MKTIKNDIMFLILVDEFPKVCESCSCGASNRKNDQESISLETCKEKCLKNDECKGIEYIPGGQTRCYECTDPTMTSSYNHTEESFMPPSVYRRGMTNGDM